jgi:hypothetical protein
MSVDELVAQGRVFSRKKGRNGPVVVSKANLEHGRSYWILLGDGGKRVERMYDKRLVEFMTMDDFRSQKKRRESFRSAEARSSRPFFV